MNYLSESEFPIVLYPSDLSYMRVEEMAFGPKHMILSWREQSNRSCVAESSEPVARTAL